MKTPYLWILLILFAGTGLAQEKVSSKTFEPITLQNKITFTDAAFNQPKFCCAFLLNYHNATYAVTAKHLLKIIKTKTMTSVYLQNEVKSWQMFSLDKPTEILATDKLLNEAPAELLADKAPFENDWLVFSIKNNGAKVKPLQVRATPLTPGEKLYVIGWTRKMETGPQRVYEFEYYKTIGNRLLLKDVVVPELLGGLSGAPVVDEQGLVVGLVSNSTVDPDTQKKYFSPCSIATLTGFLNRYQK
ncbi:MAG: trypsin-like peptidase domain-containing protein [Bacteroidota bacterium]